MWVTHNMFSLSATNRQPTRHGGPARVSARGVCRDADPGAIGHAHQTCDPLASTRRARGSTGRSLWEDIVASEQSAGPLEDLNLHRLNPVLPAQLHQLGALITGQPCLAPSAMSA